VAGLRVAAPRSYFPEAAASEWYLVALVVELSPEEQNLQDVLAV
jgi:hypothetical protein